jgi:hypothetical protein
VFYFIKQASSPDAVFKKSINVALSTGKVEEKSVAPGYGDTTQTIQYDISDPKNAKLFSVYKSEGVEMETYATIKNTYIRLPVVDDQTLSSFKEYGLTIEKNMWVQTLKNGAFDDQSPLAVLEPIDTRVYLLGQYVGGNFSKADRKKLYDYAMDNQLYKYDPKKVKTETLNGEKVYVYDVTLNTDKFKGYDKLAAGIFGIPESEVDKMLDAAAVFDLKEAKMYVSKKSKHLVKISAEQSGIKVEATYSKFNDVDFPAEPKL